MADRTRPLEVLKYATALISTYFIAHTILLVNLLRISLADGRDTIGGIWWVVAHDPLFFSVFYTTPALPASDSLNGTAVVVVSYLVSAAIVGIVWRWQSE